MAKVIINNLPSQDLEIMGLIPLGEKGQPGGVAELGLDGKVPATQLPPSGGGLPTLEEIGAEPAGAESRARQYTDEKIGGIAFPAPPTLASLGAEPVGAEARARQYTDEKIGGIAFPAPPTLASLGGEPAGAEARAKAYVDQRFPPVATPTTDIRINCGASIDYTAADGKIWLKDSYGAFGNPDNSYTGVVSGTYDFFLFNSSRSGGGSTPISYRIPVPNGNYRVELGFSENWNNSANARKFHVDIEGIRVLTSFDIWANAGGRYVAIKRSFAATVTDGELTIAFTDAGGGAQINNIRVYSV